MSRTLDESAPSGAQSTSTVGGGGGILGGGGGGGGFGACGPGFSTERAIALRTSFLLSFRVSRSCVPRVAPHARHRSRASSLAVEHRGQCLTRAPGSERGRRRPRRSRRGSRAR